MKCAVITPIGPGHEYLYEDAFDSANAAFAHDSGPFSELLLLPIDDRQGELGRSAARNAGVGQADRQGAEWLFFLDADDVMLRTAFATSAPFLPEYDAVWGQICCAGLDAGPPEVRPGQVRHIAGLPDLLSHDPFLLLQMGHFARVAAALPTPFDTALDAGEDFDYYLRMWSRYRCTKIGEPLFINRRGAHSIGPRSATGRQWREAVGRVIAGYRARSESR